ncbi:MAG: rod shape-determining protein MreD [Acidobacteria bacterium]|nr:rod shape-determining protein MreD [Acidobacteriota bacterium]
MNFVRSVAAVVLISVVEHLLSLYLPALLYMDLFLLYSVYVGLIASPLTAVYSGFFVGAIQDVLSGLSIGMNGFSKTVIGFAAATARRYIVLDSTWLRFLAVLCASLLNMAIIGGLLYILGQPIRADFVRTSLIQAVCTSLGALVLFQVVDRLRRGTDKQLARPYAD